MPEPQGGAPAQDQHGTPNPADYAGMQRAFNEINDGARIPKWLADLGYAKREDIPKPGEAPPVKPAAAPDASGDRDDAGDDEPPAVPARPQKHDFKDGEGEPDEDAYREALEKWRDDRQEALVQVQFHRERKSTQIQAETSAVVEAVAKLPEEWRAGGDDHLKRLIQTTAWDLAKGKTASPAKVQEAVVAVRAWLQGLIDKALQKINDVAAGRASGAPSILPAGPGVGPSSGGPRPGETPEQAVARRLAEFEAMKGHKVH